MKTVQERMPAAGANTAGPQPGLTQARPFAQPKFQAPPPRVTQFKQEPPTDGGVPLPARQPDPVPVEGPPSDMPTAEPTAEPTVKPAVEPMLGKTEKCVADSAPVDAEWEKFAALFNVEFRSVLHMFSQDALGCTPDAVAAKKATANPKVTVDGKTRYPGMEKKSGTGPKVPNGEKSGVDVSAATLASLFTTKQRDMLITFMKDSEHFIPERLFNGEEVGNMTAQQRILLSAHILQVGKYQPAGFEQRLHARNCGHWVEVVHAYAGASGGFMLKGRRGSIDQSGNVILITSGIMPKSLENGGMIDARELPEKEKILKGTDHDDTKCRVIKEHDKDPAKAGTKLGVGRYKGLPWSDLDKIIPGDWLYDYNANASNSGMHSLIFSHWASDKLDHHGIAYRQAVCFSQGSPDGGGKEHLVNFGEQFYLDPLPAKASPTAGAADPDATGEVALPPKPADMPATLQKAKQASQKPAPKVTYSSCDPSEVFIAGSMYSRFMISPINKVFKMSEDAHPVASAEELLPETVGDKSKTAVANGKFITKAESRLGLKIDQDTLKLDLRAAAQAKIMLMISHLSKQQLDILMDASKSDELGKLVWLVQRVREIEHNVHVFDTESAPESAKRKLEYQTKSAHNKPVNDAHDLVIQPFLKELQLETEHLEQLQGLSALETKLQKSKKKLQSFKHGSDKEANQKIEVENLEKQLATMLEVSKPNAAPDAQTTQDPSNNVSPSPNIDPSAQPGAGTKPGDYLKDYASLSQKDLARKISELSGKVKLVKKKINDDNRLREKQLQKLPIYDLVHPGKWGKKEDTGEPTGNLQDLFSKDEGKAISMIKEYLKEKNFPEAPVTVKRKGKGAKAKKP